ncbi:MAG: hypothetical protein ACRBBN_03750 [Methyloligellaceae bacterium]
MSQDVINQIIHVVDHYDDLQEPMEELNQLRKTLQRQAHDATDAQLEIYDRAYEEAGKIIRKMAKDFPEL